MKILTVIILLLQAYLNVSALVDIELRVYNRYHEMKTSETFLRVGWSLFLFVFMTATFIFLTFKCTE